MIAFGIDWKTATVSDIEEIGINDIDARDDDENTRLHHAADNRNLEIVLALLEADADIYARNKYGRIPLHNAAHKSNPKIISALLVGADANVYDYAGIVPLHLAASSNNDIEVILTLLKADAIINASSDIGYTPLHYAARGSNNPKIIEVLLEAGSDPKEKDYCGKTAYDLMYKNEVLKNTPIHRKLRDLSFTVH